MHPFRRTKVRVPLQFGALTFAGRVPRLPIAYGHAWRHFRQTAELSSQPYARLLMALRQQLGEHNGRFQFHYLLSGTHTHNAITLSHRLEYSWKGQTGAIAKIRPYDDSQAGVAYVTKCLSGADVYEMNKFISADPVTLSSSLYRVIRSLERIAEDTRLALTKKRANLLARQ